jgi:branched-chain amino acid transport system permease protein
MNYRFVIYGVILVLMMHFRPQGLLGWHSRLPYRFTKRVRKDLVAEGCLPPESN